MIDKLNADWLLPVKRLNWVKSKRPVYGKSFLTGMSMGFCADPTNILVLTNVWFIERYNSNNLGYWVIINNLLFNC